MAKVQKIPAGYHTVTPYLIIDGAAKALEFYQRAFGAEVPVRMDGPNGLVMHAEMKLGDSVVMLADVAATSGSAVAPPRHGPTSVSLMIYTNDVDQMFGRALREGATVLRKIADQFYGDRTGTLRDPFGHQWTIATHVEDVSPQEMERRMQKMAAGG